MDMFYTFGFIALIAACFKIVILYQAVTDSRLSAALNLLILSYIAQNCFEFLGYFTWVNNPEFSAYMVAGVFVSYYAVAASAISLITRVSQVRFGKLISGGFVISALLLTALHFSGFIASGYVQSGYTITAVEGALYPVFSTYVLTAVITSLCILGKGCFSHNRQNRDRCQVTLIAILPICVVAFAVVILGKLGFNASTALAMPIASTLFVWVLILDQRGDFLKFKIKWVILVKLAFHAKDIKLSSWTSLLEEMLVLEAMRTTDNNQTEAAKLLGVNKTTFHRKSVKYANTSERSRKSWDATDGAAIVALGESEGAG